MNAHVSISPLAVSDPHIRKLLQLAGLRFMCTRARWLDSEAMQIGIALKSGAMSSDEVDARLDKLGALDLVYPELMGAEMIEPEQPPPALKIREYRTPQSTIDALFGWIVRQDEATQARWLADRPKDAPYLRRLWESKCKTRGK